MCHTAPETVWGQIFYNVTCRDNEWDTPFNKKGGKVASGHCLAKPLAFSF